MNVPIGLVALLLGWRAAPSDIASERREPFDLTGSAVYVLGLGLLLLGLNQGHAWGWASAPIVGLLLLGAALLAGWVAFELRSQEPDDRSPAVRRARLRRPGRRAPSSATPGISATFLLPFALIQGRGLSPAETGLILTCQTIVMAVTASISGSLSDRIGARTPATIGMALLSLGLLLLSRIDATLPLGLIVGVQAADGARHRPVYLADEQRRSWGPSRPSGVGSPTACSGRRGRSGWCWESASPARSTRRRSA